MSPSLNQSVKIYFALLIGNYLQKKISMKLLNNVYQPPSPPYGLAKMMLAYNMITNITYNNGVRMKTSCMIAKGDVK
jgi:hypothetical protein